MNQVQARKCLVWIGVAAAGLTAIAASAQEHAPLPSGPAPILVTVRETPKPGDEFTHEKLEVEMRAALDAAKAKEYYLGMGGISGSEDIMFLSGYSSLQEMADVHDNDDTIIGDKMDTLEAEHSATLEKTETSIWRLRPDLSNPQPENLGSMRFMDVVHIQVKLGHDSEFSDVIRKSGDVWARTDPNFHYTVYQQIFGKAKDNSFLILIPVKALSDIDRHQSLAEQYLKNMGEVAHKHILGIVSSDYDSVQNNLYVFTPSMSRLPSSWTQNDMSFWHPQPPNATPAKKPNTAAPATTSAPSR
jgi:hypothetical protein